MMKFTIIDKANIFLLGFLIISCTANVLQGYMNYEFIKDFHVRSNNAIQRGNKQLSNDSLTHEMLRTIIEGQITTHDIQLYQIHSTDSLLKK